ncbi:MAG: hypothetical protein ABL921_03675 [Pirellula sp.]
MKRTIVTSGVDSEYVLGGLCEHLRSRGHEVIEFDFGKTTSCIESMLKTLSRQQVAYITSAHVTLSLRVADRLVPDLRRLYPNYLAPVEIMPILKPAVSVFVPHDLLTPYGDSNLNEFLYLDLFDHVLATNNADQLQCRLGTHTKVHDAGWIKYYHEIPVDEPLPSAPRVTLFLSMIGHMRARYGVAGFVDYLKPILTERVQVKLPGWKGIEEIEREILNQTAASIVPASTNSIDLIQESDVVICNTISSILAESILLGKPSVSLLDNEGYVADVKRTKMKEFPSLVWHPYFERQPFPEGFLEEIAKAQRPKAIAPFDYGLVETIVLC